VTTFVPLQLPCDCCCCMSRW